MTFLVPDDKGRIFQSNGGDSRGSLAMSYGIDLSREPGKIRTSHGLTNVFDEADDSDFTHPVAAFVTGGFGIPSTARYWAATANYMFYSATDDPSTGWTQDATTNTPTLSNRADAVAFGSSTNQVLFVTGDSTGTIWTANPDATGSWNNTWITTKGQSALSTSYYTPMRVGPNNYLYIVNSQTRVFNWATDINGSIATSGNGTLNISSSGHRILTLEPSSSRMWLGTYAIATGRGGVIEWDMSLNSTNFNRLHELPAPVISIAIWNDTPYAVCMNGEIHRFNGTNFEMYAKFPVPDNFTGFTGSTTTKTFLTPDDWTLMHPRGWAIIDGLPHFLINSKLANATALTGAKSSYWKMPSGIWCLDPNVGLYCRFPLDIDAATGSSRGATALNKVGALLATNFAKAKFIAGVDFYTDSAGTAKATILKDDSARTYATRARMALNPMRTAFPTVWQKVHAMHKKLGASDSILVKYRLAEGDSLPNYADVTWTSTTSFTSTSSTFASASVGDEVYVIIGDGAGCSAHISALSENAGTYTVTLNDTILGVSNAETGTVRVDNWRLLATITNRQVDYHSFAIPDTKASHRIEFLIEMRAGAGAIVEVDQIVVEDKQT